MNSLITLNKISKSFLSNKKITVLKKINYKFKKGKVYSLVGPSGSGKSTLLNILSLIDKPSTGALKVADKNINFSDSLTIDKIRAKKIGINCLQDIGNKKNALEENCKKNNINLNQVIYVGNDINDKEAMEIAGITICPADAHESIKNISNHVFTKRGGDGVVRELYDFICASQSQEK